MLDPELDLEADLGIDTVKQAETFAAVREAYDIRVRRVCSCAIPTLRHVIAFVYDNRPDLARCEMNRFVGRNRRRLRRLRWTRWWWPSVDRASRRLRQDMLDLELDLEADLASTRSSKRRRLRRCGKPTTSRAGERAAARFPDAETRGRVRLMIIARTSPRCGRQSGLVSTRERECQRKRTQRVASRSAGDPPRGLRNRA